ncbi:MAG: hypothetical protein K0Q66_1504 [Chitinophagaceae bacterium]|jgi:hypothetical protein|nr:hypothetical protein [Chitinophagaceae bacterium]
MKDKFLPILLASTILVSCSSVYRSGQTPDDVYYSPAREVVKTEEKEEEKEKVEEPTARADDQYLKIKVRNRYRWEGIDDYSYWNDTRYNHCHCQCNPGSYGYGYGYNSNYYYNPIRYNNWNSPYYPIVRYTNPKLINGSTTATNIKAYGNNSYNNNNSSTKPKNTSTSAGSFIKRVLTSSGSSVDRTERTFSGSNSSGTSTSTGTSSSAGGKSGGYGSSGSSSSGGRGGRGN